MNYCLAIYKMPSDNDFILMCDLQEGHSGNHWDQMDRIHWIAAITSI